MLCIPDGRCMSACVLCAGVVSNVNVFNNQLEWTVAKREQVLESSCCGWPGCRGTSRT